MTELVNHKRDRICSNITDKVPQYLNISLEFLVMQIKRIFRLVVADFEQVICYLNLQQIVQHLCLGLTEEALSNPLLLKTVIENSQQSRNCTTNNENNCCYLLLTQNHVTTIIQFNYAAGPKIYCPYTFADCS